MLYVIVFHLILFQGMFIIKNLITAKHLGVTIRGKNKEANISILLFTMTIIFVLVTLIFKPTLFFLTSVSSGSIFTTVVGSVLLLASLIIAASALVEMKDSWRVGVKEDDDSVLITSGVYAISRNPFFLSYFTLFLAYMVLIPSPLIIVTALSAIISVHFMVTVEERHLLKMFGDEYYDYMKRVPRYFLFRTRMDSVKDKADNHSDINR